jgi:hypothetical protein
MNTAERNRMRKETIMHMHGCHELGKIVGYICTLHQIDLAQNQTNIKGSI